MKKFRRAAVRLLTALLCLGLFLPLPARAADVYFTSVNDSLLQLTAESMPFWWEGWLYVPYNVFDGRTTGIDLGVSCSYERDKNKVSVFNLRRMLSFDLNTGTCKDEQTGNPVIGRAMIRNGRAYITVGTVCSFFGLSYSYNAISYVPQGYLVRIKSSAVVLSDAKFIDAAGDLVRRRLREYNQGSEPAPQPAPAPSTPTPTPPPEETDSTVYLAFRCESGEGLSGILDALDAAGESGVFFLTPQAAEWEGALVRRMLGSGHSVGILARGEDADQVRAELEAGARLLEGMVHLRVTLASVPKGMERDLKSGGWVCWKETLALPAAANAGPWTFAANTLRRLSGHAGDAWLTLEGGEDTARVLPVLLKRLEEERFVVGLPVETRVS